MILVYIYIYICVCVSVSVSLCVCVCVCVLTFIYFINSNFYVLIKYLTGYRVTTSSRHKEKKQRNCEEKKRRNETNKKQLLKIKFFNSYSILEPPHCFKIDFSSPICLVFVFVCFYFVFLFLSFLLFGVYCFMNCVVHFVPFCADT